MGQGNNFGNIFCPSWCSQIDFRGGDFDVTGQTHKPIVCWITAGCLFASGCRAIWRPPEHSWTSDKPQKQKQPGQPSVSILAWIVCQCVQLSFDGEKCILLLCVWKLAFLKSSHIIIFVYTYIYILWFHQHKTDFTEKSLKFFYGQKVKSNNFLGTSASSFTSNYLKKVLILTMGQNLLNFLP